MIVLYFYSAVVAIEKQFQIPSRMSGLMVSAGDFGYIPSVVFVSYLGGKVSWLTPLLFLLIA